MTPPQAEDAKQAERTDVSTWFPDPIKKIAEKAKAFDQAFEQKDLKVASSASANQLFLDSAREFHQSAQVTPFHKKLQPMAIAARGAIKLADVNLFEECKARDLLEIVEKAVTHYIKVNKLGPNERGWSFTGIFFHGQTGKNRAKQFHQELSSLVGQKNKVERQLKLQVLHSIGHFLDNGEGNWGSSSFKTILFEKLGEKFLTPLTQLIPHLESHIPDATQARLDVKGFGPAASKN